MIKDNGAIVERNSHASPDAPVVTARGVRKRFGSVEVLRGIDLDVRRGEVMCLIGPSGSGKSTFLRCINHLERIDGGTLRVEGDLVGYRERNGRLYELREKEIAARRAALGMVFQRFNLFPHMTAQANVMEAPVRQHVQRRGGCASAGTAQPCWPWRQVRTLPIHAFRRPAAARGHRSRPCDAATVDAVR